MVWFRIGEFQIQSIFKITGSLQVTLLFFFGTLKKIPPSTSNIWVKRGVAPNSERQVDMLTSKALRELAQDS